MKMSKHFHFENVSNVSEVIFHSISTDMNFSLSNEDALDMEIELSGFKSDVEEYEPIVERHGDVIDVFFLKKKGFSISFFGTRFPSLRVLNANVKLPKEITLTVKNTSGDIHVDDVLVKEMKITSVSGDLDVVNGRCERVEVKTTSGDVKINNLSEMKKLEIRCISGDVFLKNGAFSESIIHSVSGDVKMDEMDPEFDQLYIKTISGDARMFFSSKPSFQVDFSTVSGNVKIGERVFKGKTRNFSFNTTEKPKSILKFKSVSGDLNINFKDNGEELNFTKEDDETKTMLRDIMKEKKASEEEISELMKAMGYSEEEIENFLNEEGKE
jgi:DUF4097 and DUF4098 domain-containing protein YvlB